MSKRSDRAAARKAQKRAQKQAAQDLVAARSAARKAFDLKDPRFLGEAAVAATRGPVGLALFGASRGLQVARERRAENAEFLDSLAADAKQHADAVREQASDLAAPPAKRRSPLRRFAPLWVVGLAGGAAVAGATAYFLRDQSSPGPASPAPTPAPASPAAAPATVPGAGAGSAPQPEEPDTGEDLTIDSADPEGPADQDADTSPAAGSATPGPAAGSAPQPSDEVPTDGNPTDR